MKRQVSESEEIWDLEEKDLIPPGRYRGLDKTVQGGADFPPPSIEISALRGKAETLGRVKTLAPTSSRGPWFSFYMSLETKENFGQI